MRRGLGAGLCAAALLGWAAPAAAGGKQAEDATAPRVDLDALLRIPSSAPAPATERIAGATRKEWEERFEHARTKVDSARASLDKAQRELEKLASGSDAWQLAPPGAPAGSETSPVSFKLREQIRRYREDLAQAESAFTELRVQANLAGVPREWQGEQPAPATEAGRSK
jgi:hypothetical protein